MTMQIPDRYWIDGESYIWVCSDLTSEFDPRIYGMTPKWRLSCIMKGYLCHYCISDGQIFLERLSINTADGCYPEINGVQSCPAGLYENIHLPLKCTGRLLLSTRNCLDRFVMDRIRLARKLVEYDFVNGKVAGVIDHSRSAAMLRKVYRTEKMNHLPVYNVETHFSMLPDSLHSLLQWIWERTPVTREKRRQ